MSHMKILLNVGRISTQMFEHSITDRRREEAEEASII